MTYVDDDKMTFNFQSARPLSDWKIRIFNLVTFVCFVGELPKKHTMNQRPSVIRARNNTLIAKTIVNLTGMLSVLSLNCRNWKKRGSGVYKKERKPCLNRLEKKHICLQKKPRNL